MITSISSLLFYSTDLKKTFDFYKTLGFDVKKETGMVVFYVNWFKVEFIAKEHDLKNPGMFVNIKVDNLEEFYNELQKQRIEVTNKTKREFVVKDPDGYRFVFFNKSK